MYSSNCSHDTKDIQAVGKVTAFKSNNLASPSAVITGTAQFNQLGTYVTLASYQNNDVIVASSTAAGSCSFFFARDAFRGSAVSRVTMIGKRGNL